ncbi:MAG: porin family protein [Cyclobacteriaceae bacterium]
MNNKKTILLIIGIMISALTFAQDKAGLKLGANFTNLYVADVDDENLKVGFQVGLYKRLELTEGLALQPELLFTQKGASIHYDGNALSGSGRYRYNLNYLELPVLFALNAGDVNFHVGPYFAALVGANVKDVEDDGTVQNVESFDRDDFNTLDYGFSAGVGFDFDSGMMGVRYNYGFREIGESGTFAGQATNESKNSAIQLYFGFDF